MQGDFTTEWTNTWNNAVSLAWLRCSTHHTPHDGLSISVLSPNVRKLQIFFGRDEDGNANPLGVVYVLYDKKGNGKSHAGRALLREFFQFGDGKTIKGMMFSGDSLNENIPNAICSELGATSVDGWISLLLLAMDKQPTDEHHPSILILDGVNSVGEDRPNIRFIKALCELMAAENNIFVVVLTQEKEVAQELFYENGGARIIPLSGSMEGTTDSPVWIEESGQWMNLFNSSIAKSLASTPTKKSKLLFPLI